MTPSATQQAQYDQPGWNVGTVYNVAGDVFFGERGVARNREDVFDSLLQDHEAYFGGRADELEGIRAFTAGPPGYYLLQAPSGFGKSALLAQIARHPWTDTAYYFFNRHYSTTEIDLTSEATFLQVTCQQLARLRGIPFHATLTLLDLRSLYLESLTTPGDKPFLLVLDGLDEAAFKLVNYFPRQLAANVHVLATARVSADRDWVAELGLPPASSHDLGRLGDSDISAILERAGATGRRLSQDAGFVSTVAAKSNRDPFYVRYMAEDVESGRIDETNVGEEPEGVAGLLDRWWRELSESVQHGPAAVDVVSLIIAAKGPLSRADILRCLPDRPALSFAFDDTLVAVSRFLIGSSQTGLQFQHRRFRDFLISTGRVPETAVHEYADRLLAFCAGWRSYEEPEDVPPYILAYYVRHLVDRHDHDGLAALLGREWMLLKLDRYGTHASFAEDLRYVIDALIDDPVENWRLLADVLLKEGVLATRSAELSSTIAVAAAEAGDIERGLGLVELLRINLRADTEKPYLLARIAAVAAERGDADAGRMIRATAVDTAHATEDIPFRVRALALVAGLEATDAPDRAKALLLEAADAARELPDNTSGKKAVSQLLVAEQLAALDADATLGALSEALETAAQSEGYIETEPRGGLVISEIRAMDDLRAAPLDESLTRIVARLAELDEDRAMTAVELVSAARQRLMQQTFDDATPQRAFLEPLESDELPGRLYAAVAEAVAERDASAAEAVLERIPSADRRLAAVEVAAACVRADPEHALELISPVEGPEASTVAGQAAFALAATAPERALEVVESLPTDGVGLAGLLEAIGDADSGVRAVAVERAREALRAPDVDPAERSSSLAWLWHALVASDRDVAEQALADALATLDQDVDAMTELRMRVGIAWHLAQAQDERVDDVLAPLLARSDDADPQSYAYGLAQVGAYLAESAPAVAARFADAALARGKEVTDEIYDSTKVIAAVVSTIAPWAPEPASAAIVEVLGRTLRGSVQESYYARWCLQQCVKTIARHDPEQAERLAREHRVAARVETMCAVADAVMPADPERGRRLLRLAFDELKADDDLPGAIGDLVRAAASLPEPERDTFLGEVIAYVKGHEPDDYGGKARALAHGALARAASAPEDAAALLEEARQTALALDRATFLDPALVDVMTTRLSQHPDLSALADAAGRITSRYWHDELLARYAEWAAAAGDVDDARAIAQGCSGPAFGAWALSRAARSLPVFDGQMELLEHAHAATSFIASPYDMALVMAELSRALWRLQAEQAPAIGERALGLAQRLVENVFGTKSRTLAQIAGVVSLWDAQTAIRVVEGCFEKDQCEALPEILDAVLGERLPEELTALLLRCRDRSLDAQFVLVGSLVPILDAQFGQPLAQATLDAVLDAFEMLD